MTVAETNTPQAGDLRRIQDDRSDHHSTRPADARELDRELATLTTAAAGRCRRRGEPFKARWFHHQADLAWARLRA